MSATMMNDSVVAPQVRRTPDEVVADTLRESAIIRLVYVRKSTGKLWVQKIELKTVDVETRLFDVLLVSWGQSKHRQDIEFVLALDEDGAVLGTIEGLTLYVAHTMGEAREDFAAAMLAPADE